MTADIVPVQGEMDVMTLGKILVESRYFADAAQAAQAVVKVLAGREMGFGPIASMTGIHIVQGRPTLGADLLAKAVKRSGRYNYRVTELTDATCSITFFERDGDTWQQAGVSTFTIADAKRAGTKNLDKFPRNMLFARAMSNGVKWFCPDAIGLTVYDPSELPQDDALIQAPPTVTQVLDMPVPPNGQPVIAQAETVDTPPADPYAVTDAQRRKFHALGKAVYGKDWGDVGKAMIADMTGGSVHTSDMTKAQMTRLIDQLTAEEAAMTQAQQPTIDQDMTDLFGPAPVNYQ